MSWLTIGAFARVTRLSPKALRLYDELGLLRPARVDPATGYRHYAPDQVERARLVAWLRRLGMPLARIREVCELPGPDAAREVRAHWGRVAADFAARRELADLLVHHLSWREPAMAPTAPPLDIRYAALSDTGRVRGSNQDTAYAGERLWAVADGFGQAGAPASTAAVEVLRHLEDEPIPAGNLLNVLQDAVESARRAVDDLAARDPESGEVGTTLTAMLWTGSQLGLVHIGDCRAYLLRDGELFQITHDHTVVQGMIDEGRLTPEEAPSHPQRSLLARALTSLDPGHEVDLSLRDARPGDRYLLCSDGLCGVVPEAELRRVLHTADEPEHAVRHLVDLANGSGGPDNVSCVVADVHVADLPGAAAPGVPDGRDVPDAGDLPGVPDVPAADPR